MEISDPFSVPNPILLELLLASIVNETKKKRITSELRVFLHERLVDEIDLKHIAREWA